MVTLNAPDGRMVADVTDKVESLVRWMTQQPDKLGFVYTQERHLGTLRLKNEHDVLRVKERLYDDEEIGG